MLSTISRLFQVAVAVFISVFSVSVLAIGESAGNLSSVEETQTSLVDAQITNQTVQPKLLNYAFSDSLEPAQIEVFGEQVFSGGFSGLRSDGLNPNYKITPGDQVLLRVWGAIELDRVLPVDTQGNIFVPGIGPVAVGGIAHNTLNQKVELAVKSIYSGNVSVYSQLQGVQPVSVYVTGFVNKPGHYAGAPNDSILYFLQQAKGINKESGSYRSISVIRNNLLLGEFDLYRFLVSGQLLDIQLMEGDTIVVGKKGATVSVAVDDKPEIHYELDSSFAKGESLLDYLVLDAAISHVLLKGFDQARPKTEYLSLKSFKQSNLTNGDQIVFMADQNTQNILVQIEGSYLGYSHFILPKNTRLNEFLDNVSVDPELTETSNVSIRRLSVLEQQKQSLQSSLKRLESTYLTATSSTAEEASIRIKEAELIMDFVKRAESVEPNGRLVVANGQGLADVRLQDGDIITIPSKQESVLVSGQVLVPTSLVYQPSWKLSDYIEKAGSFTDQADEDKVILIRQSGEVIADMHADIRPGDEILVLPEVPTKNIQLATSISQILYQIAIAAKVALDL